MVFMSVLVLAFWSVHCEFGGSDDGEPGGGDNQVSEQGDASQQADDDVGSESPDDGGSQGCENGCAVAGDQECVTGTSFRKCMPEGTCLQWGMAEECAAGQECNQETGMCQGGAACQDDCTTVGIKTCTVDGVAVLECKMDEQGCKNLVEIQTCVAPQTCVDGECLGEEPPDNTGCKEIMVCASGCSNANCVQGCAAGKAQEAIDAFNAISMCAQGPCGEITKPAASQFCLLDNCATEWGICLGGFGVAGCLDMLQCAQPCGMDAACQFDCLAAGSEAGQVSLWGLQACLEGNCSHCGQTDQTCLQTCVQDNCLQEYMACQSS